MANEKVTISNGTLIADNITVSNQLYANSLSATGNVSVDGTITVGGKNILEEIQIQNAALEAHALDAGTDTAPHLNATEHTKLIQVVQMFEDYTDLPVLPTVDSPAEAISQAYFPTLFKNRAMANWDLPVSPGRVYLSRVPYAIETVNDDGTTTYSCAESSIDSMTGNPLGVTLAAKLLDNILPSGTARQHVCSTDTVEGADDYVGKEWAFFWEYGNYIKDDYGTKHLTSIRGAKPTFTVNGSSYTAPDFDLTKNTAAFGPAFWFICKPEKWQDPNSGVWLTDTGTEDGKPFMQLWGISDSPWNTIDASHELYNGIEYPGLSDTKKAALTALGITENDLHLWPSCKVWDNENSKWVIRPYWCHSAFCGGANAELEAATPGQAVVSACNAPLKTNISYQSLNAPSSYSATNTPGSANVNGFGMLFDIVKNATKNSQAIHRGMSDGNANLTVANYAITAEENAALKLTYGGYIFPVASSGNFAVGRTVRLVNATTGNSQAVYYTTGYNMQIGRIKEIRTDIAFTTTDGTSVTGATALIIDPAENTCNPIYPFAVCTTKEAADEIIATSAYACCGACAGIACAGETLNGGANGDGVIGYHDGSIVSLTNGRYVYRVQGTEYMPGSWICAADTVAVNGNGTTEVTYWNGSQDVTLIPTSTQYIILTAPPNIKRIGSGALDTWITAGYEIEGITPDKNATVLNEQLSTNGIAYPVTVGGSTSQGHQDTLYVGANPSPFLMSGALNYGAHAGSASLALNNHLGYALWNFAARD